MTTKKHEARGYDMKKKKIVMFGSYVADLTGIAEHLPKAAETVFGDEFKIGPGGKGSNQAVAAHRAGADITIVTKIGRDVFGQLATDFYRKENINTEYVLVDEEKGTGVALICVDSRQDRTRYWSFREPAPILHSLISIRYAWFCRMRISCSHNSRSIWRRLHR